MKKKLGKILPVLLICIVGISAALIGFIYFNFISARIYEDSTSHLREIYGQVNRSFGSFVERNWGLLGDWDDHLTLTGGSGSEFDKFIATKKDQWGFSEFYFLSENGDYMTADGQKGKMTLGGELGVLSDEKKPIMVGESMPDGSAVTVFAIPVEGKEYGGFEYDAVAISYTNAEIAASLKVDAFSGKAICFVIHSDGSVLLSTQAGGGAFANYLKYLRTASDLDEDSLAEMENNWKKGESGVLTCEINKNENCILYQPVGYQDYILLSIVPQESVSSGFLSVQKTTINVLILIFALIAVAFIIFFFVRSRDQSRKNKTELAYRERMFDVLSNSVDDIFIMLDSAEQHVDYISPNLERLLGVSLEEARADIRALEKCAVNFNVVIPKDVLDSIPLNENKYWECEYVHQTTGERRWYRMTIYNMNIAEVRKYIVVMSDRTLEQQMNQKLKEALSAAKSANEAKSNFLSNMSHDIRTPMNAIVGFSVLLEKDADNPEKVREYTHKIMASSHHLLSLINDVLDMSKIESGKTSLNVDVISLPELLEELNIIVTPQAKAKEQSFTIHAQGALPEHMLGDKLRLNQILLNLLSNAVKYTPNGGNIDFRVSEILPTAQQFVKLRFTVADNGIGMSEEFQKKVFAPFSREINSVTNKIQGTGLGMAITKNLVDLMGGIISVESAPGEGSTFTVELSFALPEMDDGDAWLRQKAPRILVADDEYDVCMTISEMMRETGVQISCVTSGAEAVASAAAAHDRGEGYNVILLDWKMPEMDGIETARRIREVVGDDVPILVLTSYDWTEIEDDARRAGINAFMPKPFFVSTFRQTIKPLLEEQEAAEEDALPEGKSVLDGLLFLVAEDNELNAEIITEMLDMEGARCELATNGQKAVEMFEASEPGHYDMILMDVQMPVMNGYEATKAIRALERPDASTIPIAAMTANTFAEDVRDALESGMDGHLAKPIDMNAVRALVSKLLHGGHEDHKDQAN